MAHCTSRNPDPCSCCVTSAVLMWSLGSSRADRPSIILMLFPVQIFVFTIVSFISASKICIFIFPSALQTVPFPHLSSVKLRHCFKQEIPFGHRQLRRYLIVKRLTTFASSAQSHRLYSILVQTPISSSVIFCFLNFSCYTEVESRRLHRSVSPSLTKSNP